MRRFAPLRPDPRAILASVNPVAKLAAAAILMASLFLSSGPVPAAIVLVVLLASVPFTGLAPRDLVARTWPLLVAALSVGLLNVLLAPGTGHGPDVVRGISLGLRLLGITSATLALAGAARNPSISHLRRCCLGASRQ